MITQQDFISTIKENKHDYVIVFLIIDLIYFSGEFRND